MGLVMTTDAGHTYRNKADLRRLLDQRDAEIARQSAELLARGLLIEKLKLQLSNLRRQRFGTKSEALDKIIDQLELALVEAQAAAGHHHCEPPSAETKAKQQPTRKPLPDHLPRENVVLSPGETCDQCGGALRHLGEDVSETLEYVPGRFKVTRTVRPKLSCRCCETIHQVPAPSMPWTSPAKVEGFFDIFYESEEQKWISKMVASSGFQIQSSGSCLSLYNSDVV